MNTPLAATVALAAAGLLAASAAAQNDRVRTLDGYESGEVTDVSPLEVTLQRGSRAQQIPVSEVRSVQFGGEPDALTQARVNALNGGYEQALAALESVPASELSNPYVRQEVEFYRAYAAAKLALQGAGSVSDAGKRLGAFVSQHRQSFHRLEASELLGDLLMAVGNHAAAQNQYELLGKTPWPAVKARGAVLVGQALQAQGKHAEALSSFQSALDIAGETPDALPQRDQALLGRAVSLGATGKVDQGAQLARQVILEAEGDSPGLRAKAYNALGACYLQAEKPKDALFAYLHVDLLYNGQPDAHAEALYHLASLWEEIGKPIEARAARQTLKNRYAATSWARRL